MVSSEERLRAWEEAGGKLPIARELAVLSAWGENSEQMEAKPVGEFHRSLLGHLQTLAGDRVAGIARCPSCSQDSELEIDLTGMASAEGGADAEGRINIAGYDLSVRAPTVDDLMVAGDSARSGSGLEAARSVLISRCVLEARHDGAEVGVASLPGEVIAAAAERLRQSDPLGRSELAVTCPVCGHSWRESLDIAGFLRAGVEESAREILGEVHILAKAYGWPEREIVELSSARRKAYLAMVASGKEGS